jgi:hypothetical protein
MKNLNVLFISNNLFLVTCIVFIGILIFTVLSFIFLILNKNKKIINLKRDNMLLIFGEKPRLSYKEIVYMYSLYSKINRKEAEANFFNKIMPKVIYDIKKINNYHQLQKYFHGFDTYREKSVILTKIHEELISLYGVQRHIRNLCNQELAHIENMHYDDQKLKALVAFSEEISYSCFVNFPQKRNRRRIAKLIEELSPLLLNGMGIKAINTFSMKPPPLEA